MTQPTRWLLGIEYLGNQYHGWQRQSQSHSVQSQLELALSEIANQPVETSCAGRTDAGVHATSQYVHFDIDTSRPEKAWLLGANTLLPDDVSVFSAQIVPEDFHARFSARERTYHYLIANQSTPSATLSGRVTQIRQILDQQSMHESAQALLGERDFSAFRSAQCQSHSVHRFVRKIDVQRLDDWVIIRISANAFLHHMVRNIVGSLLEVGLHRQDVSWLGELLAGRDRTLAAATAPASGLYLTGVTYASEFALETPLRLPLGLSSRLLDLH